MATPPERLRAELERQRDRDRPFRIAWPIAINVALRDLGVHEQVWWRGTFNEQKQVWATSYSRLTSPPLRTLLVASL